MPERFHDITVKLVSDDESPVDEALIPKSVFLQHAFRLRADTIIAPLAEGAKKDQSLGVLWKSVKPRDGQLSFEIATVLPFFLPNLQGRPEFVADIEDTQLVICSRMTRCFYIKRDEETDPLEYFLVHQRAVKDLLKHNIVGIHPLPLRTFVTKRFNVKATSAEQAVQDGFYDWRNHFLQEISGLIDAMRAASFENAHRLFPQFAGPSFPMFWLVVEGANETMDIAQFCGDLDQVAFRSVNDFDSDTTSRFRKYLASGASISVHDSSMSLASTFLHYGHLELAIVHICTASEAVLRRMYENFLGSRGVSRQKYKDAKRDITFSQLLNLHFATTCDLQKMEARESTLGLLNWARNCRNDVLHEGRFKTEVTPKKVEQALESAKAVIEFVTSHYPRIRE